jgi:sirohydrochlorin ferrochelatase
MTTDLPHEGEPATAVLLIAHGSRRDEANQDLFDLAGRLAKAGVAPIVEASFLEIAEPSITAAGARCIARGARRVLMIPFFLSMGVHLTRDLRQARDALAGAHRGATFHLAPPLGPHALLDQLVIERIHEVSLANPH